MSDRLEVDIEYLSEPDEETPYIVPPTYPRPGDFIKTKKGTYKVERIIFVDDTPMEIGNRYTAVVSPAGE